MELETYRKKYQSNKIKIDTKYSTIALMNKHDICYNRYNIYYTVTIDEPYYNEYPSGFPKSFAYWRQKVDLLCPFRFSSVIYDKVNNRRKLKYILDDAELTYNFIKKIKREFENIKINSSKIIEFY